MAAKVQAVSAGSAIRTEKLARGPKWLRNWLNSLLTDVKSIEPQAGHNTSISQVQQGRSINASGDGSGGGSSGTETMYFIDGGVLKTGKFAVSEIATV